MNERLVLSDLTPNVYFGEETEPTLAFFLRRRNLLGRQSLGGGLVFISFTASKILHELVSLWGTNDHNKSHDFLRIKVGERVKIILTLDRERYHHSSKPLGSSLGISNTFVDTSFPLCSEISIITKSGPEFLGTSNIV
jgi:hypothetical protein